MKLSGIKGETEASHELRKTCKYTQHNALRDMVSCGAQCIERIGDDVLTESPGFWNAYGWQAPRRFLVHLDGSRTFHGTNEAAPMTPYKAKRR